jgi:hypothetical protein
MGKIDTLTKNYLSDPLHFADAFNFYLFGGRQIICPDSLQEQDPTEISIIFDNSAKEFAQKSRDVLKQCILKENELASYILLGIENQADIHYAMPVKNMIYDALNYGKQVTRTAKLHRELKDTTRTEFLSGFKRTDRLKPVITLALYFGSEDWDAPRCLFDMFDPIPPEIIKYVNNFSLNLIVPKEIEDFSLFHSELRNVLQFIAKSNDETFIQKVARDNSYKHLHADTVQLINECTDICIPIDTGKKEVNMCKGIDDYVKHLSAEAVIQASIEAWQDADFPKENIISRLIQKYELSETDATAAYEKYSMQSV